MSYPSTSINYEGDGSTLQFSFPFAYRQEDDVRVLVDGEVVTFTINSPGLLELAEAPSAGALVRIYRDTDIDEAQYVFDNGVPFLLRFADANWEQAIFKLQELATESAQLNATTLRVPETSVAVLPSAPARAGKVLGFDASGSPMAVEVSPTSVPDLDMRLQAEEAISIDHETRISSNETAIANRIQYVATIADLRGIDSVTDGINYAVDGSIFIYDASDTTSVDDGYNTIVSTVAGSRYKRRPGTIHATSITNLRKIASDLYDVAVLSESGTTRIYTRTESADAEVLPVIIVADDGSRWVETSYGQTLNNYSNLLGAVSGSGTNGQTVPRDISVSFADYFGINELKMARLEPEYFTPPADDFKYINFGIWAENGGSIRTDLDVSIFRNNVDHSYVYVNPWGGNEANDGLTWATAKVSLTNALNGTAETIYLAPGVYHRRTGNFYWRDNNVRRNLNLICPNGRAVLSRRWEQDQDGSSATWTDEGGGVWSTSRSSPASVYATLISDDGDYLQLPKFVDLVDLGAADYGWSPQAGGLLYVKLPNGEQPTFFNCAVFVNDGFPCATFSGENTTLYLENIDMEGGEDVLRAVATGANDAFKIYAKNCTFKYGYSGEGVSIYGATHAGFQNCVASSNTEDGFSYHSTSVNGNVIGVMFEVDCVGRKNGAVGTGTNNGSTLHDGWIGVRVNSSFYKNYGPNVPDVLGSKSWNVGVVSMDSLGVGSVQGFQSGASDVYLDRCTHSGGGVGLLTNSAGRLYLRNTIIDGTVQLGGNSTLSEY